MVTASEQLSKNSSFQIHFHLENKILYCKFCNYIVNHKSKSVVENQINSLTHLKKKREVKADAEALQTTILSIYQVRSEKQEINLHLVEAFTKADILLEKIDKLKPFLINFCKNSKIFYLFVLCIFF